MKHPDDWRKEEIVAIKISDTEIEGKRTSIVIHALIVIENGVSEFSDTEIEEKRFSDTEIEEKRTSIVKHAFVAIENKVSDKKMKNHYYKHNH